jgi:hypothetical protein
MTINNQACAASGIDRVNRVPVPGRLDLLEGAR